MNIKYSLVLLIALYEIWRNLRLMRKNEISLRIFLIWGVVWFSMLVYLLLPGTIERVSAGIGFESVINLVFIAGILILYLLVHELHLRAHKTRQDLARLAREQALSGYFAKYGSAENKRG